MIENRAFVASFVGEDILKRFKLDAIVFTDLANIRYLSGFTGSDAVLFASKDQSCFLTDSRYSSQAKGEVRADEIRQYSAKLDGIISFAKERGYKRLGFEAENLSCASLNSLKLRAGDGILWVPLDEELKPLRSLKASYEIDALEEAAKIAAESFDEILPMIKPGVSEREVSLALEFAMKRRSGEEKSFDIIVASGVRGALPHGIASDKLIEAGELVTIDYGTKYHGYHSDETVTLAVGEVDQKLREIFDTVLEAHDRAMEIAAPGMPLKEIDAVARDYIAGKGFGDYFGHGLGHGVGLEVHEFPTVSPRSESVAEEGMVFTIEPGIYIPEIGGVRIEDMVQVTGSGVRPLTRVPKEFRSVPQ